MLPPATPQLYIVYSKYIECCEYPFENVGVDYAGSSLNIPDIYSKSKEMHRCYILLFTWATTSSVRLELVIFIQARYYYVWNALFQEKENQISLSVIVLRLSSRKKLKYFY